MTRTSLPTTQGAPITTAIVTGAASGIGKAITERMTADGVGVFGIDINAAGLKELSHDIPNLTPVPCDLADLDATAALPDFAPALAHVDVLVNCAGKLVPAWYHDFDLDDAIRAFNVMAIAPMVLSRMVLPHMYQRHEKTGDTYRIINIGSIYSRQGGAIKSAYAPAKWALHGFNASLAQECAQRGVMTALICPGHVNSPLLERQFADEARLLGMDVQDRIPQLRAQLPANRFVEPWEVADMVWMLATTPITALNGTVIPMDTGWVDGQQV